MELIGLIILGIVLFVVLGLDGWLLELIGTIGSFLADGCSHGCGCVFSVIAAIFVFCLFLAMI